MGEIERIKRLVAYYMRLCNTSDPFEIADRMGILYHALLDRKSNCYFIRNKTLLLNSRLERRANLFAAYLLISDDLIAEFNGYTIDQMSLCTGYPKELIELRLK